MCFADLSRVRTRYVSCRSDSKVRTRYVFCRSENKVRTRYVFFRSESRVSEDSVCEFKTAREAKECSNLDRETGGRGGL